jgi:hypothetical protein
MKVTLCRKPVAGMHEKKDVTRVTFTQRLSSDLTSLQIPDTTDATTVQDYKGEIEEKSKAAGVLVIIFPINLYQILSFSEKVSVKFPGGFRFVDSSKLRTQVYNYSSPTGLLKLR